MPEIPVKKGYLRMANNNFRFMKHHMDVSQRRDRRNGGGRPKVKPSGVSELAGMEPFWQ